tara:strand:- start:3462 stop:4268 length:807 start_codon:yes stop_codon:yes gene_type:complete
MRYIFIILILSIVFAFQEKKKIIIQSTTSIRDSGFYDYMLNEYNKNSKTKINVVAVGTGQALRNAKNCDGDLLFVHHKPSEIDFVLKEYGLYRKDVMYNHFILVGPKNDPAKVKDIGDIKRAFKKIFDTKSKFVSRGDNSGTHKKEQSIWKSINKNINPKTSDWYLETGSGMGTSLNVAVNLFGYILTDRATWISYKNKNNHVIFVENEPNLLNFYGIIPINPKKCPNIDIIESEKFIGWILSEKGQSLINSFRINNQKLFFGIKEIN